MSAHLYFSQICGTAEFQRDLSRSSIKVSCTRRAAGASCPGPCPGRFQISPQMETSQYLSGNPFFLRKEKPNKNLPMSTKGLLCVRTPLRFLQKNKCKILIEKTSPSALLWWRVSEHIKSSSGLYLRDLLPFHPPDSSNTEYSMKRKVYNRTDSIKCKVCTTNWCFLHLSALSYLMNKVHTKFFNLTKLQVKP